MEYVTAIVLAAGKGSRMNSDIPKQYLELCGKPVVYYALQCFQNSIVDDIVLVVGKEDVSYCKKYIIDKYQLRKVKAVVEGGTERYWSVKKGLLAAEGADYVLIHDAARPCLDEKMIEKSIDEVKKTGACTVGVPVKDTIKVVDSQGFGMKTLDRSSLWQIQTPQSFAYRDIQAAYKIMEEKGDTDITDDTMIIERYLHKKTRVIMGDYCNIKITTPEDLLLAKNFLEKNEKSC